MDTTSKRHFAWKFGIFGLNCSLILLITEAKLTFPHSIVEIGKYLRTAIPFLIF